MKLDFGCGEAGPRAGYLGVDIRPLKGVKFVCAAWEIDKHVSHHSAHDIYARHFFEHLTFEQCEATLKGWRNVLVEGGRIELVVPDLLFHIEQFVHPRRHKNNLAIGKPWTDVRHALAGFYGWQREGIEKVWDVHKSGFDFYLLESLLDHFGFLDVQRKPSEPWNLHITAINGGEKFDETHFFENL